MPPVQLVLLVVGLLVMGALSLVVWEKLLPTRPVRRRRVAAAPAPDPASAKGPAFAPRPRGSASPAPAPVERAPAIVDWPAHEAQVRTLLRQRDHRAARRQIAAALADPGLTDARRPAFEALQADAVGAEIGQLTADAVRGSQQGEGPAVLASLEQAATLLAASGAALPRDRREEIERRLSLSYTKVGTHRLEAGRLLDAGDALLRAVEFAGDGRRAEPCAALAKALRQLPETPDGGHEEARRLAEELEATADAPGAPAAELVAGIRALLSRSPRTEPGAS